MDTQKKTGLGSSLLLQRTEVPLESALKITADIQTPETLPASKPSLTPPTVVEEPAQSLRTAKKRKPKLVLVDRCTLYIERALNERLSTAAHIEGRQRSEIINDLLQKHLPKYRIEREK